MVKVEFTQRKAVEIIELPSEEYLEYLEKMANRISLDATTLLRQHEQDDEHLSTEERLKRIIALSAHATEDAVLHDTEIGKCFAEIKYIADGLPALFREGADSIDAFNAGVKKIFYKCNEIQNHITRIILYEKKMDALVKKIKRHGG